MKTQEPKEAEKEQHLRNAAEDEDSKHVMVELLILLSKTLTL